MIHRGTDSVLAQFFNTCPCILSGPIAFNSGSQHIIDIISRYASDEITFLRLSQNCTVSTYLVLLQDCRDVQTNILCEKIGTKTFIVLLREVLLKRLILPQIGNSITIANMHPIQYLAFNATKRQCGSCKKPQSCFLFIRNKKSPNRKLKLKTKNPKKKPRPTLRFLGQVFLYFVVVGCNPHPPPSSPVLQLSYLSILIGQSQDVTKDNTG